MKLKNYVLIATLLLCTSSYSQKLKILFDATKAETAGNADWVISGTGSTQIPSPAQSGITSTTPENFWTGGLSSWGIDCVKQGYYVETLPVGASITYGSTSNTQDLKNYKVFVVCEPNSQFTAAEKTAIMNFVKNGGGLFMVSDHTISDRNNDGWDSPMIWNDFLTTNSVQVNPFGIAFDLANISQTTTNVATLTKDSILHGTMGSVTEAMWSNGTTMTLNKTINSTVLGQIFKTGSSTTGTTNVMFATARYGSGKVAAIGDSSPCDDGTGNSGNSLYDGYWTDAAGNHQKLLMNATIWLATANKSTSTGINNVNSNEINLSIYPNPILNGNLHFSYSLNESTPVKIQLFDATGKVLRTINFKNNAAGTHDEMINVSGIGAGMYLGRISTATGVTSKLIEINR